MRWELLMYAAEHGISTDEALIRLAGETVEFFEKLLEGLSGGERHGPN